MKRTITLLSFSLLATFAFAQVPNNGFETWVNYGSYSDPANWETSNNNVPGIINVTQSDTVHSGSSAMRMKAWYYQGYVFSSAAACPYTGGFFAISGQPTALTGWYIADFLNGDKAQIPVVLTQGGNGVGGGSLDITTSTSIYQQFTIPFVYSPQNATPDSAAIGIALYTSSGGGVGLTLGTYAIFDDLQLVTGTGIADPVAQTGLEKIYPNPAGQSSWVQYTISSAATVSLGVYDMNGKLVQALVEETQQPGRYRVAVDAATLASGIYFVRLQTGNTSSSMKLSITGQN